jgi:hypothetical protein
LKGASYTASCWLLQNTCQNNRKDQKGTYKKEIK